MQRRTLGNTGLQASILGMGGFHLIEISTETAQAILNGYLDAGGNYVETAAAYGAGVSERKVGTIMRERRHECILATKCHVRDRDGAAETLSSSLDRLQTEHVDILFMHHVQSRDDLDRILAPDGALRAAEAARDAGQVRYIGISNHGHPQLMMQDLKAYPFDLIMTNFNY
jgi:aryl-alcohol dehydrogenase-like predicted oxidoreductase